MRGYRQAAQADLVYVHDFEHGYSRRRCGKGFTYLSIRGKTIRSDRTRRRIEALAIPPAWKDVWICPRGNGHIQAMGRDEAGRKQYIYHPRWRAVRQSVKFHRLELLAQLLPRIRRRVRKDLNRRGLQRERVIAAVVRLIDKAALRVGNADYTEDHGSRGATTLDESHVDLEGIRVSLDFPAKSGRQREVALSDRKLAKLIDQLDDLDGQFLFRYRDDDGEFRGVDSDDVNRYIRDAASEAITAKDFRTWSGTAIACAELSEPPLPEDESGRRRRVREAVTVAASHLGNSVAVCRSSYIHPALMAAAETGELTALMADARTLAGADRRSELTIAERLLAALLPKL